KKMMLRCVGIRKVFCYYISTYHRLALLIENRQLRLQASRKIIAVCEQAKREIIDAYGTSEEKVLVVHNGVDHERFHPRLRSDRGEHMRRELGIPANHRVVLFLGTGFRRKGLGRLLRLWDRGELAGIYLVVVGNDAKLLHYRKQWSNKQNVIFV